MEAHLYGNKLDSHFLKIVRTNAFRSPCFNPTNQTDSDVHMKAIKEVNINRANHDSNNLSPKVEEQIK